MLNADSRQVYVGMDIGTSKIQRCEMEGFEHRLIDLVEPSCQWPVGSAQWRPAELPSGGQQNCPLAARCSARSSVDQWRHPLSGGGLGEADAVTGGEHDVGVVQQPVDGGVGDGLGHQLVEAGGVKVAR